MCAGCVRFDVLPPTSSPVCVIVCVCVCADDVDACVAASGWLGGWVGLSLCVVQPFAGGATAAALSYGRGPRQLVGFGRAGRASCGPPRRWAARRSTPRLLWRLVGLMPPQGSVRQRRRSGRLGIVASGEPWAHVAQAAYLPSPPAWWRDPCNKLIIISCAQVGCAQEHASLALAICRLDVLVRLCTATAMALGGRQ